jgi:hypothetical protein
MGQVINVDIGTWRTLRAYQESIKAYPKTGEYAVAIEKERLIYQEMITDLCA